MWDESTSSFPNFNGAAVEVWEWISNSIPNFTGYLITYPCWDFSSSTLAKAVQVSINNNRYTDGADKNYPEIRIYWFWHIMLYLQLPHPIPSLIHSPDARINRHCYENKSHSDDSDIYLLRFMTPKMHRIYIYQGCCISRSASKRVRGCCHRFAVYKIRCIYGTQIISNALLCNVTPWGEDVLD